MEVQLYNAMPFYGVQASCRKGNCRVQASTVSIHKNIHRWSYPGTVIMTMTSRSNEKAELH